VERFRATTPLPARRPSRRTVGLSSALLAVVVLASGCASARPGVAAQVGDTRVTVADVDQATSDLCVAFLPQIKEQGATYPLKVLSEAVVRALTSEAIARGVSRDFDIPLPSTFQDTIDAAEAQAEVVPEDVRGSYIEVAQANAYAAVIMTEAGRLALEDEGAPSDVPEEQAARGAQIFSDWVADNTVEIDPRYALDVVDGQVVPTDTSVSLAVGSAALAGAAEQMDPPLAAQLPSSQRCN
jgi:hypothetical protein